MTINVRPHSPEDSKATNKDKDNKMKITIYKDLEKTEKLYDMELSDYLLITANELFKDHWAVIELGDIEIKKTTK